METRSLVLAAYLVLARLVVEPNTPQPQLENDAVLLVQRHGLVLGCPSDAGPSDAGTPADGPSDAGVPSDGGLPPSCEKIEGDAITMVVRPQFTRDATGARFAVLYVTPRRPLVETVPDQFVELAQLTAPKTEFREVEVPDASLGTRCESSGCGGGTQQESSGCGGGTGFDPSNVGDADFGDGSVGLEQVGPYEIVRAQPADPAALAALLDSFNYLYQQDDLDAVAPYLARGYTVIAVRVAIEPGTSMPAGRAMTPIAMTWEGTELRVPIALGGDSVDLKVYVAADARYEFPGADVPFAQPTFSSGETSYLTLNKFPAITGGSPDDDPVATRVDTPPFHQTNVVEVTKRVPVNDCSGEENDAGWCRACNAPQGVRLDWGVVVMAVAFLIRRRRRVTSNRRRGRAAP